MQVAQARGGAERLLYARLALGRKTRAVSHAAGLRAARMRGEKGDALLAGSKAAGAASRKGWQHRQKGRAAGTVAEGLSVTCQGWNSCWLPAPS